MKGKTYLIIGAIQVIVAIGAIPAGYSMLAKPDGSALGMTVEILAGSPFKDFFIPGLFLFLVNGVCNLAGAVLCFIHFRYAPFIAFALGIALIIWIVVQVYSVGLMHILQSVYFATGIMEIILSLKLSRRFSKISAH